MDFLYSIPGLLSAIIIHELSHGYMAYLLGDNTAKDDGRLSLNPINHIDPLGFICMILFKFGWAKPVPINSTYFKNRKLGTILVSLAGPFSNFIMAIIIAGVISFVNFKSAIVFEMFVIGLWYNIMLGVFNLLPFPPLDGSKVVASLLPVKYEYYFYKYEREISFLLLILIVTNVINKLMGPMIDLFVRFLLRIYG